jgi:hypothetical protein
VALLTFRLTELTRKSKDFLHRHIPVPAIATK